MGWIGFRARETPSCASQIQVVVNQIATRTLNQSGGNRITLGTKASSAASFFLGNADELYMDMLIGDVRRRAECVISGIGQHYANRTICFDDIVVQSGHALFG